MTNGKGFGKTTVHEAVRRVLGILLELHDEWQTENLEAVLAGRSDMVSVSSGGTSDPTEQRALEDGKYAHRDRVARTIARILTYAEKQIGNDDVAPDPADAHGNARRATVIVLDLQDRWLEDPDVRLKVAATLERIADRAQRHADLLHPAPTGHQCVTDGCKRDGLTPDGRCAKCSWWMSKNRGVDPATVKGLVAGWNKTRVRLCECVSTVCAEHPRGHGPDECTSKLEPDDGRTCGRCRKRIHDHNRRHQEAS